jgi:hypothetical protein
MVRPNPDTAVSAPGRNHAYSATAPRANQRDDPRAVPFTILIDQQEKAPFAFGGLRGGSDVQYRPLIVPTRKVHLPTGDYSLAGIVRGQPVDLRQQVCIERKSLVDLFGSLAGKDGERRERFKAEHERMQSMIVWGGVAHVVIEAARDEARNSPPEYGAHPSAVLKTSVRWPRKYGVQWHWAGTRLEAEKLTFELLADAWEFLTAEVK